MFKKKQKIVIVSHKTIHGGSLAMHYLCYLLRQRGFDARIFLVHDYPRKKAGFNYWIHWLWFTFRNLRDRFLLRLLPRKISLKHYILRDFASLPFYDIPRSYWPFVSKSTIVLYSEMPYGNMLHATRMIRWFLLPNQYPGDKKAYGSDVLFMSYRSVVNDFELNPSCLTVTINYFDASRYRQYNFGERSGCCYFIRKGDKRKDLPTHYLGPILDWLPEDEKVAVLNEKKICYVYDMQTFYASIAAVCGCLPICIPEGGKTRRDYLCPDERGLGCAYGESPSEIEYALATREEMLKSLDFSDSNRRNIDRFIELLAERWPE